MTHPDNHGLDKKMTPQRTTEIEINQVELFFSDSHTLLNHYWYSIYVLVWIFRPVSGDPINKVSISVRLILPFNGIGVGIISIRFTYTLHVSVSASVISVKIESTRKNLQAACSCVGMNIQMCISTGSASIGMHPWHLLELVPMKVYRFNTSKKPTSIFSRRFNFAKLQLQVGRLLYSPFLQPPIHPTTLKK